MRHLRAVYIAITWLLATYLVVSALWPPAALPLALTVMILALLFELYLDAITEGDISGIVKITGTRQQIRSPMMRVGSAAAHLAPKLHR